MKFHFFPSLHFCQIKQSCCWTHQKSVYPLMISCKHNNTTTKIHAVKKVRKYLKK